MTVYDLMLYGILSLFAYKDATFEFFSIDNRLCINQLIIDNRNFSMPSQSVTHHAPRCHCNMVSGWRCK